jgi:multidrug resistance efflux pump
MSDRFDNHPTSDDAVSLPTLVDRVRSLRLPSQAPRRGGWLPWALCGILLLTSVGFGFLAFTPGRGQTAETAKPADRETDAVAGSGNVVLESKGYIIPAHQIQVSPKVGGLVTELNVEEGMRVQKGDVLARIETDNYEADRDHAAAAVKVAAVQVEQAEAGIQQSEASQRRAAADLDQARAKLLQAERDWDRARRLGPTGALAIVDFDAYKAAHDGNLAAVRSAEAALAQAKWGLAQSTKAKDQAERNVALAKADLRKAEWYLDQCVIKAPIAGTILTKKAEKGNIVNPVAFNISASLCDMADLSDLEVELSIQERDVAGVFKGQQCRVVAEAFRDRRPYPGVVSRLMPTADRAKGAIPVRVKLRVPREEEGLFLKPDMSVIVSFLKNHAGEGTK